MFIDLNIYRIGKYFYIIYKMTIDIHSLITGKNPITRNLMKPWGSNKTRTIWI